MELYFLNDEPKMIYDTKKYARVRPNVQEVEYPGGVCYICDALSYEEAMERLIFQSNQAKKNALRRDFAVGVNNALTQIIDPVRGDGFSFMMMPVEEWADMLTDFTVPEVYKNE